MYMSAWTCASRSVVLLLEARSPLAGEPAGLEAALAAASTATIVTDVDVLHKTATGLGGGPLNPDEPQAPTVGRAAVPYASRITAGHHSYGGSCPVLRPEQTESLFQTASGMPACKHVLVSVPMRRFEMRLAIGSLLRRAAAQAKASHLLADTLASTASSSPGDAHSRRIRLTRLSAASPPSSSSSSSSSASASSAGPAVYASPEDADCGLAFWLGSASASSWMQAASSPSASAELEAFAALPVGGCTGSLQSPGFLEGPTAVTVPVALPGKSFATAPITVTTTLAAVEGVTSLLGGGRRLATGSEGALKEQLRHASEAAARLLSASPASEHGSAGWRVLGHLVQVALPGAAPGGGSGYSEEHALRHEEALREEAERTAGVRLAGVGAALPPAVLASMPAEEAARVRREIAEELKRQAEEQRSATEQQAEEQRSATEQEAEQAEEEEAEAAEHVVVIVRTVLAGHSVFDPLAVDLALHGQSPEQEHTGQEQSRLYGSAGGGGSAVVLGGSLVPLRLHDALRDAAALHEHGGAEDTEGAPTRSAAAVLLGLGASRPDALGGRTIPRLFLHGSLAETCGGPLSCATNGCRAAYSVGRVVGQYSSAGLCPSVHDAGAMLLLLARRPVAADEAERAALLRSGGVAEQCRAPVAALGLPELEGAATCEEALVGMRQAVEDAGSDAAQSDAPVHPADAINGVIRDVTASLGTAVRSCAKHHQHGVLHEEEQLEQNRARAQAHEEEEEERGRGALRGSVGDAEAPLSDRAALARDLVVPASSHFQSVFEQCALLGVRSVTTSRATMSSAVSQDGLEAAAAATAAKMDQLTSELTQQLALGVKAILSASA